MSGSRLLLLLPVLLTACAHSDTPTIKLQDMVWQPVNRLQDIYGAPKTAEAQPNGDIKYSWVYTNEQTYVDYRKYSPNYEPEKRKSFFDRLGDDFVDSITGNEDPEDGDEIVATCTLEVISQQALIASMHTEYDDNFNNHEEDLPSTCDHFEDVLRAYYKDHLDMMVPLNPSTGAPVVTPLAQPPVTPVLYNTTPYYPPYAPPQ